MAPRVPDRGVPWFPVRDAGEDDRDVRWFPVEDAGEDDDGLLSTDEEEEEYGSGGGSEEGPDEEHTWGSGDEEDPDEELSWGGGDGDDADLREGVRVAGPIPIDGLERMTRIIKNPGLFPLDSEFLIVSFKFKDSPDMLVLVNEGNKESSVVNLDRLKQAARLQWIVSCVESTLHRFLWILDDSDEADLFRLTMLRDKTELNPDNLSDLQPEDFRTQHLSLMTALDRFFDMIPQEAHSPIHYDPDEAVPSPPRHTPELIANIRAEAQKLEQDAIALLKKVIVYNEATTPPPLPLQ